MRSKKEEETKSSYSFKQFRVKFAYIYVFVIFFLPFLYLITIYSFT